MDSDSDSPFNYSWPSFPKMRMQRKTGKKGNTVQFLFIVSFWLFTCPLSLVAGMSPQKKKKSLTDFSIM